jgi:RNA recognition motif-containing protein
MSVSSNPSALSMMSSKQQQHAYSQKNSSFSHQPNVVFVGNLSYFCEEQHLFRLFSQYGHVQRVFIVQNDSNTKSLMFGFVTLLSDVEAREIEKLLHNHLFMGRRLRYSHSFFDIDGLCSMFG